VELDVCLLRNAAHRASWLELPGLETKLGSLKPVWTFAPTYEMAMKAMKFTAIKLQVHSSCA